MFKYFGYLTKAEKIIVAFLSLAVIIFGFQIGHAFYRQHTGIEPVEGGIYTEGIAGKIGLLNPL